MAGPIAALAGAVVVSAAVLGGVLGDNASKNASAMVDSSRIQAMSQMQQVKDQQETEQNRIKEEGRQANMWNAYDVAESKADRREAIVFQQRLDASMGVNQSERYINQASANHGYSDHAYPPQAS